MRLAFIPLAALLSLPALAAEDIFASRPAFSGPEQPPRRNAECHEIRQMAEGLDDVIDRIDLAITGTLTLVKTDGALWYLGLCTDLRILCVTYEQNGMKAGDRVTMRGGYIRRGRDIATLDPCLARAE
jgi:hypothetical protein